MGSGAGVSSAKRLAGEMPALLSDEFGTLPIAVSPGGDGKLSGLVPVFVEPRALTVSLFEKRPALVVTTWESPALRDPALRNFVEAGGNLLIVPVTTGAGASAAPASWLGASVERMEKSDTGSPLLAFKKEAVVFADLRNEKGDVILRNIKAFKFQPLKLAEESGALLGLEDGRALMAEKHLGKGVIFTSGLAMDSSWTTLPLKAGFLALAQNMALAGGDPAEMFISLVAGDTPRAAVHGNDLIQIQTVTGSPLDWRGESANLPALPRSGVYAVRAGTNATYVSVRGSDKEGQRKFLGEDRVAALGSLSHTVKSFSDAEAMASLARKTQVATELFLPLLLLALACLAAEGWLANQPPQKPNLAKAKPTPAAEPSAAVIK